MIVLNHTFRPFPNLGEVADRPRALLVVLTAGHETTRQSGSGDWAAYAAIVPESWARTHPETAAECVGLRGSKLRLVDARAYFPNLKEEDYRL